MNGIAEINPCPFCEKTEYLMITPKEVYEELVRIHGGACVSIQCWMCGLTVTEYDTHTKDRIYENIYEKARDKWNSLRSIKEKTDVSSAEDTMHSNGITSSEHTTGNIPKKTV